MPLAALLVALAGPIARQVLISLGIGFVTYVGLDAALTTVITQAQANVNSMSADLANYVGLFGGFQAFSILAGGLTTRVSMIALKRFKLL